MEDISAFISATSDFSAVLPLLPAADTTFGGLLPPESDMILTIDDSFQFFLPPADEASLDALFKDCCIFEETDAVAPAVIPDWAGPATLPTPDPAAPVSDDDILDLAELPVDESLYGDATAWTTPAAPLDIEAAIQVLLAQKPDLVQDLLTSFTPSPSPSLSPSASPPPTDAFLAEPLIALRAARTRPKNPAASAATSDRRWPCRYTGCDWTFGKKHHLQAHLARHAEVRDVWTCAAEGCGKTFGRKYELARHAKTHTGEARFACGGCGRKFTRKDKKVQHERRCASVGAGYAA